MTFLFLKAPTCWARLFIVLWALLAPPAQAHAPSTAYLTLNLEGARATLRLDVSLRDLDRELHLDADDDARITWGELRTRWQAVDAATQGAVELAVPGAGGTDAPAPCGASELAPPQVEAHSDGMHAVLIRQWQCPRDVQAGLQLRYTLFEHSDPAHRGLLRWQQGAAGSGPQASHSELLTPGHSLWLVAPAQQSGPGRSGLASGAWASLWGFVVEGVHHILIGTDHVLFLVALLLPAVGSRLGRRGESWQPAPQLRPVLLEVLKLVTAFTVAHSLTLALAVLGWVTPSTRWVESLIAVSVAVTALDNLWPFLPRRRWPMTLAFGLVHGFGFASALASLGLQGAQVLPALLGFNLGVELGQLCIVALWLPMAWLVRCHRAYPRGVLGLGSGLILGVALVWFIERAFDLSLWG